MLVSPLYTRWPYHRAKLQYLGVLLCAVGLLTSGFAAAPWHVLVTIGIVYPVGGALYYFPVSAGEVQQQMSAQLTLCCAGAFAGSWTPLRMVRQKEGLGCRHCVQFWRNWRDHLSISRSSALRQVQLQNIDDSAGKF